MLSSQLLRCGFRCVKLDGRMSSQQRDTFNTTPIYTYICLFKLTHTLTQLLRCGVRLFLARNLTYRDSLGSRLHLARILTYVIGSSQLLRCGFRCVKLDGRMSPQQRDAVIQAFMTNPNVTIFLVSLKVCVCIVRGIPLRECKTLLPLPPPPTNSKSDPLGCSNTAFL